MTETDKAVTRRTRFEHRIGGCRVKIVVTIGPGDFLHLREQGRRKGSEVVVPIADVYKRAVLRAAQK